MPKRFFYFMFAGLIVISVLHGAGVADTPKAIAVDKNVFADTLVEMTWPEIKQEAGIGAVVLFPVAVVEEHGPHMELSPDIYLTMIKCRYIRDYLRNKNIRTIIAPPFYWGMNVNIEKFPGSFSVKPETFKALSADAMECLKTWGFRNIFFVNEHGDLQHNRTLRSEI